MASKRGLYKKATVEGGNKTQNEKRYGNARQGGVKCEVRGGKMRGTGARYQCEATGSLRGWNVRGATDNWRSRCRYRM